VLVARSASAGDERRLQLFVAGGNAVDLTTTLVLANHSSVVEGNPLMQRATVPVKASATAVEMYMVHRLWRRGQHRAATAAAIGVLAGNCVLGLNNIRITR
jgi:hypothetical protein